MKRPLRTRHSREPAVAVGDPRLESWDTVSTFADQDTAVAWRDQLRSFGLHAACTADHPPDKRGHGDIYLVVAPGEWSAATEILDNLT